MANGLSSPIPPEEDELPLDLRVTAEHYAAQPVPCPHAADSERLLQSLLREAAFVAQETSGMGRPSRWQWVAAARWRIYLLGPWFWSGGVLLLLAGFALAPHLSAADLVTMLILLLPLLTVLSLAYAFRTTARGLREVEASCSISFAQTTMSLGLAILLFDASLGLLATFGIALASYASFWNLLLAWLAPLLVLSALALPIALLPGARWSPAIAGVPWLLLGLLALADESRMSVAWLFFAPSEDIAALVGRLATVIVSLLLLIVLTTFAPRWPRLGTYQEL